MSDHALHVGNDGLTEYLLTTYDDGTQELATRPLLSTQTWSPPTQLVAVPPEVTG
jgi:hypothetical protein